MRTRVGLSLAVAGALMATTTTALTTTAAPGAPQVTARVLTVAAPGGERCPRLRLAARWYGDNGRRIQRVIDRRGRCSWDDGPPQVRPYAVFDWDNTMIKNDISDQTIFWMLRRGRILQPPDRDWRATSRYMTRAGARALSAACDRLARPGEPLPTGLRTRRSVRCADEILSVRLEQTTTAGRTVFDGYHHRRMEAMYAWVGQVLQGYTPQQVRAIARRARAAALRAEIGATQRVGSTRQTAWIRYYRPMRDLVRTLRRAGIEPWIVSASPQEFADVWGRGVGIDRAHTIGVAQLRTDGRLNGHLEGCGGVRDGADSIMTYVDGKRCFMYKRILGLGGPRSLRPLARPLRPVLAGGDATTDVSMLSDASGVRVVLNRNSEELMCRAYDNADGRWLVNPMFIEPLPRLREPYPCSSTAYTRRDGEPAPVRRPDGSVVPDQRDVVHGPG